MISDNGDLERVIDDDPYWRERVRCVDPDEWFPEPGEHSLAARKICLRECPVKAQCLATALKTGEHYGIWGGLTVSALRKAQRERTKASRAGTEVPSVEHYLDRAAVDLEQRVEDTWDQSDIDLFKWASGES